jgi:ribulose-5-phosphate 4-epimerase/fuculose-1-phosphate aldolase
MNRNNRDVLIDDLVRANHILAARGIVDGFGHVSARDPEDPAKFLIARSMAPALVGADDIMTLDLDGTPAPGDDRKPYLERFIHGEIYRARDDVRAIVHSHTQSLIPFGITSQPLRPVFHMAATIGAEVPVFEIRDTAGDASDLLVKTQALGKDLVQSLDRDAVVLMRGHGMTAVGGDVREAVFRAVYAEINARLQADAMRIGSVTYLSDGEIAAAAAANWSQIGRAWALWLAELRELVVASP